MRRPCRGSGSSSTPSRQVGYPWTTLPDNLFAFGASGFGDHGTLCGALGGSACIINMITYEPGKAGITAQMIDRLFWWYAEQEFPTDRFEVHSI